MAKMYKTTVMLAVRTEDGVERQLDNGIQVGMLPQEGTDVTLTFGLPGGATDWAHNKRYKVVRVTHELDLWEHKVTVYMNPTKEK